jgi:fatty acid desaturase
MLQLKKQHTYTFVKKLKQHIMKKNMGTADKAIRIVIALIIAGLYFTNIITGTLGIILLVLGAVFLLTSFISFCPLYLPFGISTCKVKEKN